MAGTQRRRYRQRLLATDLPPETMPCRLRGGRSSDILRDVYPERFRAGTCALLATDGRNATVRNRRNAAANGPCAEMRLAIA